MENNLLFVEQKDNFNKNLIKIMTDLQNKILNILKFYKK